MSTYQVILSQFQSAQQLYSEGDLPAALALYDGILEAKPELEEVHVNRGVVLRGLKRFDEAVASFDKAIQINPNLVAAYSNRGRALTELGRLTEALRDLDHAVFIGPDFPDAHNNRGVALRRLNRASDALINYERAIALDPAHGEAWSNRGDAYDAENQPDAAIQSFDRALSLMPRHVDTLLNCAFALQKKNRFREAEELLERASQVDPHHKLLLFATALGALRQCDWATQDVVRERLLTECAIGKSLAAPLALLHYSDDPDFLYRSSGHYLEYLVGSAPAAGERPGLMAHEKIRLAYVSGDFHEHATAYLSAGLFERHDRSRFEVHGFSLGPRDESGMQARLRGAFDQFHDLETCSDCEVVALSRKLQVDIAIDLKGFTSGERPGIFTRRAAPIQVNYLGYPGTMAADCWDYVIADPTVLPRTEQPYYAEQIVHLSCCYQVNDPRKWMEIAPTRQSLGLPDRSFVFCCFNNHSKISKPVFDIWMRLLKAVPESLLWLLEGTASGRLRSEAISRGVDPARLVFAPLVAQGAHLARLSLADLVLDTLPYNAHTTASDALWTGVPIITCRGKSFAGRVGASLLASVGLPELVTEDLHTYEALALKFARDHAYRDSMRMTLIMNKQSAGLFDGETLRLSIEKAYSMMVRRAHDRKAPAGFDVDV